MQRKIRVIHCIGNFQVGGTELNLVRTLERLDRRVFDLSVHALTDIGPLRERVAGAGIPIHSHSFAKLGALAMARRAIEVTRWLRQMKPDVVHSHDVYTNVFIAPCARLAGVPLVVSSRRWWTAVPHKVFRLGNRIGYRMSHRVLANSPAVAKLIESEGVPERRIVMLPNFVEEHAFETLPREAVLEFRRRHAIPDQAQVVIEVARLSPEKDLQSLIAAVALLRDRMPNLHLLLVGNGPCEMSLRQEAADRGIEDRVHFAGFLSSPPNLHQYGDLSVLCSLHEGFPNSIVEAMAAGKAVVATNVGGIPDAVEAGKTGLLVPPQSPSDLAKAIERLMSDHALRENMGQAAKANALARYSADTVITQLQALYLSSRSS